jgi:polysaccharide biosynthesis transport protein
MTAVNVYRTLWRNAILIVVLTGIVCVATWAVVSQLTRVYEASTLVRVQQRSGDPTESTGSLLASQALAQTYAVIVGSGALDNRVRSVLVARSPSQLVPSVDLSAAPVQELELIWISARSTVPAGAMRVANAAPTALRNFVRAAGTPRDRIITVKPASLPTSAVSPDVKLDLALAFLVGLVFNCALVLLFEVASDRLPEAGELESALGMPVLVTLPRVKLVSIEGPKQPRGRAGPPTRPQRRDGVTPGESTRRG